MFKDQVAEEGMQQEEVQGQELTPVPMAETMFQLRVTLLVSSQAIRPPGMFKNMTM